MKEILSAISVKDEDSVPSPGPAPGFSPGVTSWAIGTRWFSSFVAPLLIRDIFDERPEFLTALIAQTLIYLTCGAGIILTRLIENRIPPGAQDDLTGAVLQSSGYVVVCFTLLTAVLLSYLETRRSIFERKEELEIYELTGATPLFTRIPFHIEATVPGFAGGGMAALLLVLAVAFEDKLPAALGFFLAQAPGVFPAAFAMPACGALLAWIGSWIAWKAPL